MSGGESDTVLGVCVFTCNKIEKEQKRGKLKKGIGLLFKTVWCQPQGPG